MKRRNKIMQEITRNVANVFSFYVIIAIEPSVFNTSLGTWRMLMHEKTCLIPILNTGNENYFGYLAFNMPVKQ